MKTLSKIAFATALLASAQSHYAQAYNPNSQNPAIDPLYNTTISQTQAVAQPNAPDYKENLATLLHGFHNITKGTEKFIDGAANSCLGAALCIQGNLLVAKGALKQAHGLFLLPIGMAQCAFGIGGLAWTFAKNHRKTAVVIGATVAGAVILANNPALWNHAVKASAPVREAAQHAASAICTNLMAGASYLSSSLSAMSLRMSTALAMGNGAGTTAATLLNNARITMNATKTTVPLMFSNFSYPSVCPLTAACL